MIQKDRPIKVYKYLLENTDEEHPATIKEIIEHLETEGVYCNRKTVADDIVKLQKSGFDIICNRSRQNRYFVGSRDFELAELKTIVDAVQAAKFITTSKSNALIEKLSTLCSPYQAEQLKRNLYIEDKIKTDNETIFYTIDLINNAINNCKVVTFQYVEYTPTKKRTLKHNGKRYCFSPYDLVWNNDAYYVIGWSEGGNHNKIVKFRVDRIIKINVTELNFHKKPKDYSIGNYIKHVFSMYEGEEYTVTLLCENSVMKDIIDNFGTQVKTSIKNKDYFYTEVKVSVSQTFYAWIFAYAGKMRIIKPESIVADFKQQLSVF